MYIFSLVAGGCVATGVDEGGSKKKDEDKSIKAAATTTTTTTGARGTTLIYTRVFRLYGLYTQL